jgi:hypothetical protein
MDIFLIVTRKRERERMDTIENVCPAMGHQ